MFLSGTTGLMTQYRKSLWNRAREVLCLRYAVEQITSLSAISSSHHWDEGSPAVDASADTSDRVSVK